MKLRKFLPLIAVLLLMLVAIPLMVVSASAEEATPSEGLEFKLSGNKAYYIVQSIGDFKGTELVIPATYEGKPVERIAQYAFRDQKQLTSVVMPDSINYVGHAVFYNCTGLTSVKISNGLKTIGSSMFQKCSALTSIVIPDSVTAINKDAFRECTNLADIQLSANLQSISQSVFRTNKAMTTITIPDTVTFIDHAAFYGCTQLRTVVIPGSVKNVPTYAFYNCGNLRNVTFEEGVETIGNYAMAQCPFLNTVNLPDSLTTIGLSAFRMGANQTSRLKAITIPENVTSIGNYAFFKSAITEINIPVAVTNVGNNAFSGCNALKTVYYGGADEATWNTITMGSNALLVKAARYYYAEEDPQAEGFWHYVNGVPTVWEVAVAKEFTVTFNANGQGTAPAAQSVVAGATATAPEALVATGYTFGGWYTDADCTAAYDFAAAVTADITLYAKWTINTYTVTFDANGQGTAPAAQTVNYGASATAPEALVATGYTFGGWYTDAACTEAYAFGAVTADVTVYAKWTVVTFTVTFDANGQGTAPAAQTVEYGKTATAPEALVATGYTFGGWYTDAACTNAYDFGAVTADVTVYAKWTVVTFTVTFNANGKGTAPAAQTVEYGKTATAPTAPTAEGFDFDGWYTDADCTVAYDFDAAVTANVTLYAKWSVADDVVIGGDPDDGDLEMPEIGI